MNCFLRDATLPTVTIYLVKPSEFESWLAKQTSSVKTWIAGMQFRMEPGQFVLVPTIEGQIDFVLCCMPEVFSMWAIAHLPIQLPFGCYELSYDGEQVDALLLGWGLGAYQFTRYKEAKVTIAQLFLPEKKSYLIPLLQSLYAVRDLINTPTDDLGPTEFSEYIEQCASNYGANFHEIKGKELLSQNYPCIYTVGRASDDEPRLIDMRWGEAHHPKITLVGKGVCFDTGGLDIKSANYMALMKKDMGGAAHVLGLAKMMMDAKLPIRLRVLIPLVENSIAGNAYHPGDIIKSRLGLTIEVGNTDAEGRLILADALTEAVTENPDLLIDLATLTGAARIALGPEVAVMFSNNDKIAHDICQHAKRVEDPMWRLPLYAPYRDYINSLNADISNNSSEPYGGAITAAIFLQSFVPDHIPWVHFDIMAWNIRNKPGRPQGGEAMGIRALFAYLQERFSPLKR